MFYIQLMKNEYLKQNKQYRHAITILDYTEARMKTVLQVP